MSHIDEVIMQCNIIGMRRRAQASMAVANDKNRDWLW